MTQTPPSSSGDLPVYNYAAAFIDVLGQREELARFPRLPDTSDPVAMREFETVVKATVGAVMGLRERIQSFFDTYSKHAAAAHIPEPLRPAFEKYSLMEIHLQPFSDGLFIYVPLAFDKIPVPIRGIFALLTACGMASLLSLAAQRPVRGGIEIGWGVECNPNELYGSVVARAYELESKVARYPRFVVGEQLAEYIQAAELNTEQSIPAEMGRAFAAYCRRMLTVDDDGYPIVDYLGRTFKEVTGNDTAPDVVQKAYDFVLSQSWHWKQKKNTELAFRYSLLRDYFHVRLPDWGVALADETVGNVTP